MHVCVCVCMYVCVENDAHTLDHPHNPLTFSSNANASRCALSAFPAITAADDDDLLMRIFATSSKHGPNCSAMQYACGWPRYARCISCLPAAACASVQSNERRELRSVTMPSPVSLALMMVG